MKKLLRFQAKVLLLTAIFLIGIAGVLSAQKIAIIEAGSSGSRLYVYELDVANKTFDCKYNKPGKVLSELVANADTVMKFLTEMTALYPEQDSGKIQLYVLATAGMRGKDTSIYKTIMQLSDRLSKFELKAAMTISGRYEGFCAWIAANYRNGRLGFSTSTSEKPLTYTGTPCGILEIGGASMQIAFAMNTPCSDCISRKGFGNIRSVSYLGGGVNAIYSKCKLVGEKYDFFRDLEENFVVGQNFFPDNLKIWGLGGSIGAYFESGKNLNQYIESYVISEDTSDKHPRMNAEYIKYVTEFLKLGNRFVKPGEKSSWTEGAALDILLVHPTFSVIFSCNANSLSSKYLSSLNP